MSLAKDSFPASVTFDAINDALSANEGYKADALKQGKAIFAITLKNDAGETDTWYIDLAKEGKVTKDLGKSDVELRLSDADFTKLVLGKAKAQSLFMTGKLKIKGNVMKAAKLEPILNKAQGMLNAKL